MRRAVTMVLLAIMTTTGCTVTINGDSDDRPTSDRPTAPKGADGVEEWDLRTRPTAQDVGMPTDRDYVSYETDEPRPVRFLLPEGRTLEADLTLVVFDRITVPATTDTTVVTGMDFRAGSMPLDDAYALMRRSLTSFGLDTRAVQEWRTKIEDRPTTGPSASLRIEGGASATLGYLKIGVGGVFRPVGGGDTAIIKYGASFGDG